MQSKLLANGCSEQMMALCDNIILSPKQEKDQNSKSKRYACVQGQLKQSVT